MNQKKGAKGPRWLIGILGCTILALLFLGGLFFENQKEQQLKEAEERLWSVAQLKNSQIFEWRVGKTADAIVLAHRFDLVQSAKQLLSSASNRDLKDFKDDLLVIKKEYHFADILLVDLQKRIRLNLIPEKKNAYEGYISVFDTAISKKNPIWTPIHVAPNHPQPHFSLITPLFESNKEKKPIGAFVLVFDSGHFLYPLLKTWPTPTQTAEILLLQKDGNEALILNELRHQKNTALKLRVPLNQKDQVEARAVRGEKGFVLAKDYRGIKVAAVILPIADSPWIMIAKMDQTEAFAEWRTRSFMILVMVMGAMAFALTLGFVAQQGYLKSHYRSLYLTQIDLSNALRRHSITLQSIGDAVIATDSEGRIELMNAMAEKLTGWEQSEAAGKKVTEVFRVVNEETRLPLENPVAQVLKSRKTVSLAHHSLLIAKDGRLIPVADSGAPIIDGDNDIKGVVLVFNDQTQARDYQNRILESERKYRLISDNSIDVIWTMNLEFVFTYINPAIFSVTGYTQQEWIGSRLQEHCDRSNFEKMTRAIGREITLGPKGKGVIFETVMLSKKRRPIQVEIHGKVIFDSAGRPASLQGVTRNITERKQNEQARLASEERFRLLVENAPDAIFVQVGGFFAYLNPAAVKLFGAPSADLLVGTPVFERIHPDCRKKILEQMQLMESHKRPTSAMHEVCLTLSGESVDIEASAIPMNYDGKEGALVFARDITERIDYEKNQKKLQDQLYQAQKMESVGRLAGGVAHDYNNILSVIIGFAELSLEEVTPDQPIYYHLQEILKAALRSRSVTQQLLAFARKDSIRPKVLDLNVTIESMLKMIRRLIGEDIDLVWQPLPDLWPVKMDPSQIDQILANLCVNARDAIENVGRIIIELENRFIDENGTIEGTEVDPGDYVCMVISDTGCGMNKALLKKIFDPFFTTKEIGRGTGLGLATVYGIVKQNKGFIHVYSEEGRGTTFRIYLPRHRGTTQTDRPPIPASSPEGRGELILVVEDDPAILNLTEKILAKNGYTVLSANSPTQGIELVQRQKNEISLLITDVIMPEMNGRELLEKLRNWFPELNYLFMSGYTADVIAKSGVIEADVNFIEKPFSSKDLTIKVGELLRQKETVMES